MTSEDLISARCEAENSKIRFKKRHDQLANLDNYSAASRAQTMETRDKSRTYFCMKYSLIFGNMFCFILSIFNSLFGIAYQDQNWPGGYTGELGI